MPPKESESSGRRDPAAARVRHLAQLVLWGGICLASAWPAFGAPPARKPNIIVILTDDQGYADVGKFGATGFATPHLDRMADQGAVFRNFHVAQPVCSASRASLLTGCYANRVGIHLALGPGSPIGLSDDETTLAQLLRREGYATAMYGKWHLGDAPPFAPLRRGFDEYFGLMVSNDYWPEHPDLITDMPASLAAKKRGYPNLAIWEGDRKFREEMSVDDLNQLTTWYTERAVNFIERHTAEPFFLYVAHSMPHVPLGVSDKFRGKSVRGLYGDVIEEIDWSVGQILAALQRTGLDENTWVIFTSDNGPWLAYGNHAGSAGPLREGKITTWEGGTRVPCFMRWPGHIPAGLDSWEMLMTIDLLPTIARQAGAALPDRKIDGLDVWPLLSGQPNARNPHDAYWFYYEVNELQAVVSGDGRWKLQLPHTYHALERGAAGRDGLPGTYRDRELGAPMLFDLAADLGERNNVCLQYPEVVQRLQAEAEKARADLGDSLTKRSGPGRRAPGRLPEPAKGQSKAS